MYKIKFNKMIIIDKKVFRKEDGTIDELVFRARGNSDLSMGILFEEDEMQFLKKRYEELDIYEV